MKFTVRFFARARDLVGQASVVLELEEGARIGDLRTRLAAEFPPLQPLLPHLLMAVQEDYVSDETIIPAHSEVACFPPVSGG